jgi:hypothetical protein
MFIEKQQDAVITTALGRTCELLVARSSDVDPLDDVDACDFGVSRRPASATIAAPIALSFFAVIGESYR